MAEPDQLARPLRASTPPSVLSTISKDGWAKGSKKGTLGPVARPGDLGGDMPAAAVAEEGAQKLS